MTNENFDDIPEDVKENYQRLREQRDVSWEQLAADQRTGDRRLAAWMRSQSATVSAGDTPPKDTRTTPPRGRGTAKKAAAAVDPGGDSQTTTPADGDGSTPAADSDPADATDAAARDQTTQEG